MLTADSLTYSYKGPHGGSSELLCGVNLCVEPGQMIGLIGGNGSGKSTLARLLNGLLRPTGGVVKVDGLDTRGPNDRQKILGLVGMVFQNPDSQLVATVVEEDVAFGPENQGLPVSRIRELVDWALQSVGISHLRSLSPQRLSGGQKQRVAIAAALALSPRYLILDEPTSMLDPAGRRDFLLVIDELKRRGDLGIVFITHRLEELRSADQIYLLQQGRLQFHLPYSRLGQERDSLTSAGMELPAAQELSWRLQTPENALESFLSRFKITSPPRPLPQATGGEMFALEDLGRIYDSLTPWRHRALEDISWICQAGESVGVVGSTGSGKSTMVQHLNGLLRPQVGKVAVSSKAIPRQGGDVRWVRRQVGLLFQNPEHQFFEETVSAEVAFGPRNFGLRGPQLEAAIRTSLESVGLDFLTFRDRSPYELSGGEKRLVALASVLAFAPSALVLDEPTAGLDAHHRRRVLRHLKNWQAQCGGTLVVISHELDDLALLVERCLVLDGGRLLADGNFRELLGGLPRLGVPYLGCPRRCLECRILPSLYRF